MWNRTASGGGVASRLMLGVAAGALALGAQAGCAQSSPARPPAAAAEPPPEATVGEVVVTARKREESLVNVPESVTAISGTALERSGAKTVSQLVGAVPSLFTTQNQTFGPAPSQTFLVIRGVGATAASDPAVGTFVDGVYQTSLAFNADFLDVKSVEVLRGPQGALFGRNTEGGAVSITTRTPGDAFTGKLMAEAGSFGTYKAAGTVSGPIVADKVYAGLSLQYDHTDGYLENVTLGQKQDNADKYAARATLRLTPTDDLEIILRGNAASDRLGYVGFGVPDDGSHRYITLDDQKRTSTLKNYGASATVNYKIGDVTLTSITGMGWVNTNYWFDFDSNVAKGNFQNQQTDQSMLSQELRAAGHFGPRVDWLVGYYYFHESFGQARDFGLTQCSGCTAPPYFNPANQILEDTGFNRHGNAVFGQLIYRPIDKLDITLGGRYSSEHVSAHQIGLISLPSLGALDQYDGVHSSTFDNFSPSGSIAYHWTPRITSYLTVAKGFKPGGYDKYPGSSAAVGIPFRSETSINYEVGIKAEFLNRIYVQTDGFYVSIKNQQLASTVISPTTGVPIGATANVGQSSSRGFEFEGAVYPIRPLRLSLSTAYVDAVFDKFSAPVGSLKAGDAFPYIPKWTAALQAEYTQALPNAESLVYDADYRYIGSHYNGNGSPPFDPILQVPSCALLDLKVSWRRNGYELAAYVNNVTDQFCITSRYRPAFQTYTRDVVLPPRAFGLRAMYQW